jgi:feruloyl esterase
MPFRKMFDVLNLNLSSFIAHGGKLLMYHGWADPLITPYGTVALYEDESQTYGSALANNDRLFMVPGMAHCSGGPGADQFDPMTAIINWAEIGAAPAHILSRHFAPNGSIAFTRTLCAYPDIAAYEGGNTASASSYACVAGPTGVPGTSSPGDGLQLP